MKKLIINENWEEEAVSITDFIYLVIVEDLINNLYYIYDDSTEESVARTSFEVIVDSLKDVDWSCYVHLVKLPNTPQVQDLVEMGNRKSTNRDLISEILGRPDCEVLETYSTKLQESRKKKKKGSLSPFSSMTITTGDPVYNMKMFNKHMGTDFEDQAKEAAKEASKETASAIDAAVEAGEGSLAGAEATPATGESSSGEGASSSGEGGAGLGESMDIKEETIIQEDDLYAHVNKSQVNLPDDVKLLSQAEVEAFVKELDPAQLFEVGYITPFTLYSQINSYFKVLKATVFKGYTGIDYRDVSLGSDEEKAARLERAKQQIKDNPDGAHGWMLNPDGFSAEYRGQTNKLARNVHKADTADIGGQKIDMNRILFYPELGSKSKAAYYVGYKKVTADAQGRLVEEPNFTWVKLGHKDVVGEFMKHFREFMIENAKVYTPEEAAWVQKKLNMTMPEFIEKYPGVSVASYKIAVKFGMDPVEYVNKYPFTKRWTLDDLRSKLEGAKKAEQDMANLKTTSNELNAHTGLDLEHGWGTDKPQVRALYTNQIFYLSTDGKTLGNRSIIESLNEMLNKATSVDDLFDMYYDNWLDCDVDYDELYQIFTLGLEGKAFPENDLINAYGWGDDFDYCESMYELGKDIYDRGLQTVIADEIADKDPSDPGDKKLIEDGLNEAKRYVKRYYIRPQNVFASNKEEILKALVAAGDQNCSVYSLKDLEDHDDVHLLKPSDIIYYYDNHVLYDKNHVQVMDYDLFVKHEEERKKVADIDAISDATFDDMYDDRLTDADLKDKEIKVEKPTHEDYNPFVLDFDDVNAYGESLREGKDEKFICCICGEESTGYGNNPEPVKHEGRCCDACNRKFVIPARIEELNIKDEEE